MMTVAELIGKLKEMPQDYIVVTSDEYGYHHVHNVYNHGEQFKEVELI